MKDQPRYSAREVVEMLKEAKALGFRRMKIQGDEFDMDPPAPLNFHTSTESAKPVGGPTPQKTREAERPRTGEYCRDCNAELVPSKLRGGKPYCVQCYIRNKETSVNRGDFHGGHRN